MRTQSLPNFAAHRPGNPGGFAMCLACQIVLFLLVVNAVALAIAIRHALLRGDTEGNRYD
jgi:hypothetical protein